MTGGTLDHSSPRRRRRQARRAARQAHRRRHRPGTGTGTGTGTARIGISQAPLPPAAETSCHHDRRGRGTTYMVIHPSGTATVCSDCHTVLSTDTHPTILTPPPPPKPRPPEPPG